MRGQFAVELLELHIGTLWVLFRCSYMWMLFRCSYMSRQTVARKFAACEDMCTVLCCVMWYVNIYICL